jgi:hypothetical protein
MRILHFCTRTRYDILGAESIYVTVPGSAVTSQQPLVALPLPGSVAEGLGCVPIVPSPGSVVLSGTCDGVREEDVRSLAECEVLVELRDDAWVAGLVALPAGDALVQGLRATVPQPAGWDAASEGVLTAKDLYVIDATHAVIVVSQLSSYDILFADELRLHVPAGAVESHAPLVSNNTLRILPSAGRASLSGSLLASLDEAALRGWVVNPAEGKAEGADKKGGDTGGGPVMQLTITLSGDSFVEFSRLNLTNETFMNNSNDSLVRVEGVDWYNRTTATDERTRLIRSIASSSFAPHGWNTEVQAALRPEAVEWVSETEVRVMVQPARAYAIDAPETVVVDLDASLLSSQARIFPRAPRELPAGLRAFSPRRWRASFRRSESSRTRRCASARSRAAPRLAGRSCAPPSARCRMRHATWRRRRRSSSS